MGKITKKSIEKLDKKEAKILNLMKKESSLKNNIYKKVPEPLLNTLETAFAKAFQTIFLNGTRIIEKTFNKDNITLEYDANNYILNKNETKKNIKRLDKPARKTNLFNHVLTTTAGVGLGVLGMGLPDIPLLVGTILKGIYQISLSYGISYESEQEKVYILRLIRVALLNNDEKRISHLELDSQNYMNIDLKSEIEKTSKIMARELLVEKFVQGIPVIGVYGGVVNYITYKKISKFAVIKYKKRYLENL